MVQLNLYSTKPRKLSVDELNDMLEILEDAYEDCCSKRDDYYRQIALIHLLLGLPNESRKYNKENASINFWIYKLYPIIKEYRKKYGYGEI